MRHDTLALLIALAGTFLGSLSQYLLKKAAGKSYASRLAAFLNPQVLFAYALFFAVTLANLFSLKYLPLYLLPVIEATSYVYVALFAALLLKERVGWRRRIGLALIILGVLIASL